MRSLAHTKVVPDTTVRSVMSNSGFIVLVAETERIMVDSAVDKYGLPNVEEPFITIAENKPIDGVLTDPCNKAIENTFWRWVARKLCWSCRPCCSSVCRNCHKNAVSKWRYLISDTWVLQGSRRVSYNSCHSIHTLHYKGSQSSSHSETVIKPINA